MSARSPQLELAKRYVHWLWVDNTDAQVELAVQVNGKVRGRFTIAADADKDAILAAAKAAETVAPLLAGKTLVKEIVVPGKLVNLVVR